ncbi:ATP-binding protein [Streptomyces sp. NPDC048441]|uniref:ATP-binding protein n=1 Tax=Streptomyces sp. NPDC048441 TaxID=3365552 RepID=UPI00371FBA11
MSEAAAPVPAPDSAPGPAIGSALDALCCALGSYLGRLRSVWGPATDVTDLQKLFGTVGTPPGADEATRLHFGTHLAGVMVPTVRDEPYARLCTALGLDPVERLTTAAVWWAETDPQFGVLLGCGHDDGARRHASASLLRLVLLPFGAAPPPSWEPADPLIRLGVLAPGAGPEGPLALTATARRLLSGLPLPGTAPHPVRAHARTALTARIAALLGGGVLLRGSGDLSGMAYDATAEIDRLPLNARELSDPEVRVAARFGGYVPVLPADRLPALAWSPGDGALIGWGSADSDPCGVQVVDVPQPSPADRATAWDRALGSAGLAPEEARAQGRRLGARLTLDGTQAAAALTQARAEAAAAGRDWTVDDVWRAARRLPRHELGRLADLLTPAFVLDDLSVPADVRAQLDEVIAHVALQDVVLDDWGFRARLPRGQGVAVLLSGPPGTGKTMAAEALANGLGQDLFRIDLSAVVSKYIGETEKNLALAFDDAERCGALLFFDECDALFGKRTEQRDAHDRWANLEVNYLLQRVETFTGLVILATNKQQALDEAFLRRLRFSIRFELPDRALRRELWLRSFPADAPCEELDVDALSRRELAGGSVRNAALAAAFLAASDGGRVRPAHLTHALRREYDKLGKVWAEETA